MALESQKTSWLSSHKQHVERKLKPRQFHPKPKKKLKIVYLKPNYDLRMFPPVPRHSQAFKDKFKTNTSVERSNKRMFVDYHIENI